MKKTAIVYFSGTGNTKYAADLMKAAINKKSIEVDLINVEKDKIDSEIYNQIIIGGPVYVERYPELLLRYIEKNLSNYNGSCMLFSTQSFEGPTPVFKHAIKRIKHLNVTYYDYIPMPNNFYAFMFKRCSEEKEKELIKAAEIKAERMATDFIKGQTYKFKISSSRVIIAEMTYRLVYPFFRNLLLRKLKIDKNRCINCGLCEKSCPVKSISINPELKFDNNCAFCQRCIHNCPKNAFTYKEKNFVQYKPKFIENRK